MSDEHDMLKLLRADPTFRRALSLAKTDEERRAIIALTENLVGGFQEVLSPLIKRSRRDPLFAERLGRALLTGEDVLTDSEPVTGSIG